MQRCPECRYKQGYYRTSITPAYRCRKCGHEWDLLRRCQECGHPRWLSTMHLEACVGCGGLFDPAYVLDKAQYAKQTISRLRRSEGESQRTVEEMELSHRFRREAWLRAGGVRSDGLLEVDGRIVDPSPPQPPLLPLSAKAQARQNIRNWILNVAQTAGMGILAIVAIPVIAGMWLGFAIFEVGQLLFALLLALSIVTVVIVLAIAVVGWIGIGVSDLLRTIWRKGSNQ